MALDLKYCLYEKKGRIAYVTINRPEVLNAVNPPCNQEMYEIWSDFNADPEVWVAILTGAGERAFCAGSDIKYMAQVARGEAVEVKPQYDKESERGPFQEGGMAHREIWKPIIAAVNGFCVGGGLEIAMACDIIIATEGSRFGLPEIRNVGGYPGDGGLFRLPRHIPLKIAMDLLLTGRMISAEEALRYGLINQIVPRSELMATATAKAEEINQNPPISVRLSKEAVLKGLDRPLEYPYEQPKNAWQLYDELAPRMRASEDWKSREGPRAFAEKRRPVWKGR